jgi:glyoxylase-like metal-dependent hydrolase (beta-lactamase superfamily II)
MASLDYPYSDTPAPGKTIEVAPGLQWLSMPLPFALDHINLWLVGDTIIDTGIGDERTRGLWDEILAKKEIRRVILTHYHPDHAGNAAWLCQKFGVPLWTTQGEYLTAHAVRASSAGYTSEAVIDVFLKNGLEPERVAKMLGRGNRYAALVPDFPSSYRRIIGGDRLQIGGHEWRAFIGHGHAPEHLSLYCEALKVVIAGDMLLSTISTNVSVWSIDPEGDPLRLFLESLKSYRELPADVLVLPSHGKPFRGARTRVAELESHHQKHFAKLTEALKEKSLSAGELLGLLFRRPLDAHQTFFAMGEAIAHLHYLYYAGSLKRTQGTDGIMRYAAS